MNVEIDYFLLKMPNPNDPWNSIALYLYLPAVNPFTTLQWLLFSGSLKNYYALEQWLVFSSSLKMATAIGVQRR